MLLGVTTPSSVFVKAEFLSASISNIWNRRVELTGGHFVVMHSRSAIVQYAPAVQVGLLGGRGRGRRLRQGGGAGREGEEVTTKGWCWWRDEGGKGWSTGKGRQEVIL